MAKLKRIYENNGVPMSRTACIDNDVTTSPSAKEHIGDFTGLPSNDSICSFSNVICQERNDNSPMASPEEETFIALDGKLSQQQQDLFIPILHKLGTTISIPYEPSEANGILDYASIHLKCGDGPLEETANSNNNKLQSHDHYDSEYRYQKSLIKDKSCYHSVRRSRLIICMLVLVILGLASGLVYFLLHDESDNIVPANSDHAVTDSSIAVNQTRECGRMPKKYLNYVFSDVAPQPTEGNQPNASSAAPANESNSERSFQEWTGEPTQISTTRRAPIQARIFGGRSVSITRFPWQAMIWLKGTGMTCGGALIMPNWIVTAAHCTDNVTNSSLLTIYMGASHLDGKDGPSVQRARVISIIKHPSYVKGVLIHGYDICLMKLSEPFEYTQSVQPICLPEISEEFWNSSSCFISGWGSTENNGAGRYLSNAFQSAQVDIIGYETCRREDWLGSLVTDRLMCAGKADGSVDACTGDSGGPLSCYNADRGAWTLAGIVSFGRGCGHPKRPGVYTKMNIFVEWTWAMIGKNE